MKSFWRTPLGLVLALVATAGTAKADAAAADTSLDREVEHYLENNSGANGEPSTFRIFWKTGINMESGDGSFKIKFGGRLMYDMTFADGDDELANDSIGENYHGFRRARFYFSGTVYKNTVFKVQIDFAGGDVALRDVYVGLKKIGNGSLLIEPTIALGMEINIRTDGEAVGAVAAEVVRDQIALPVRGQMPAVDDLQPAGALFGAA